MSNRQLVLVAHDIRSAHNVGSLLRTAEGLGVKKVYLTGHTPYPVTSSDGRLPHEARKADMQIRKTALGAEDTVAWQHLDSPTFKLAELKAENFMVTALEQSPLSVNISTFAPPSKAVLIVGSEVNGLADHILKLADVVLELPMLGRKESFNVAVAAAMALYHFRFFDCNLAA